MHKDESNRHLIGLHRKKRVNVYGHKVLNEEIKGHTQGARGV
jgi:hypothetical protein